MLLGLVWSNSQFWKTHRKSLYTWWSGSGGTGVDFTMRIQDIMCAAFLPLFHAPSARTTIRLKEEVPARCSCTKTQAA